jgi:hypothetical protein
LFAQGVLKIGSAGKEKGPPLAGDEPKKKECHFDTAAGHGWQA